MDSFKSYQCFISSPGDCLIEREKCQKVIDDFNNGMLKHLGIMFKTLMWENDVLPDFGNNPQEIVNKYLEVQNYDIFIGIMKKRFGTTTNNYGSGTEEEFFDALRRKDNSSNNLPLILFFFGKPNINLENLDVEQFDQYQKVKNFKNSILKDGIIISFENEIDFELLLKEKIQLFIRDFIIKQDSKINEIDIIDNKLKDDLENSLKIFNEKSPVWIDPIISSKKEIPENPNKNDDYRINIKFIIDNPCDLIIKAPSEFGLTTLAHYLKLEAWKLNKRYLYIDSKKTKQSKVVKLIYETAQNFFNISADEIDCILIDSVCFEELGIMHLIKNIADRFPSIPLIIFNTLSNNFFLKSDDADDFKIERSFTTYYLLPLPQNDVRKIVKSYSNLKCIEEDSDVMLNKVTKDLETLNMHRTPKNCISILRAENQTKNEYSPVNRTKLLEIILGSIFEEYDIPTYHDNKFDLKDFSFVLGYFCETLVKSNTYEFSKDDFVTTLNDFCKKNFIKLNIENLFNTLYVNALIDYGTYDSYYFRNTYWVYYFIAQRMNMNKAFKSYIFTEKKYIDYPEIIEFYTGIDRIKEDALEILKTDLLETYLKVKEDVNITDTLNPYINISWNPNIEMLEKEEANYKNNIMTSGLPEIVKDQFDDNYYDQIRPYNQVIKNVMHDFSFLVLMRQITATSRALRNSDYVEPEIKIELINLIISAWHEINKLLIALSPILADKGNIDFEGAKFSLIEDHFQYSDPKEKRLAVLLSIPTNVVKIFKDDIYSTKMGPLLIDKAKNEENSILKHELMILLVAERPEGWINIVNEYIIKLDKNSFFLSDMLSVLEFNFDYKTTEISQKRDIELLASKCRAKHIFNKNNPDLGLIKRAKRIEDGASNKYIR